MQVKTEYSWSINHDEGVEPSVIVGIPASVFDAGCVVNTSLPGDGGGRCPCAGVNGFRSCTPELGRPGSSDGKEPSQFWQGGVPKGGLPGVEAATQANCNEGVRLKKPAALPTVAGDDKLHFPLCPDDELTWPKPNRPLAHTRRQSVLVLGSVVDCERKRCYGCRTVCT